MTKHQDAQAQLWGKYFWESGLHLALQVVLGSIGDLDRRHVDHFTKWPQDSLICLLWQYS
jgi:hypothetical protein